MLHRITFGFLIFSAITFQTQSKVFALADCRAYFHPTPPLEVVLADALQMIQTGRGMYGVKSPIINAARLKLVEILGAHTTVALFGYQLNRWPFFLGFSADGKIILGEVSEGLIYLKTLKSFPASFAAALARQDFNIDASEQIVKLDNYDGLIKALNENEDTFSPSELLKPNANLPLRRPGAPGFGAVNRYAKPWIIDFVSVFKRDPQDDPYRGSVQDFAVSIRRLMKPL